MLINLGKMTTKRLKISDAFEQNTCGVCGNCEINQFFNINDNFIEYCGIFYSFREILATALDLQVCFANLFCKPLM